MRWLVRHRRDDRGATLVLVALALVILVGFVGFAVDIGRVYNERRQEQSAVDSAALAAARDAFLLGSSDDVIFDVVVDQTLANADDPVSRAEWVAAWQDCTDPGRLTSYTAKDSDGNVVGYTIPLNTSVGTIDCISFTPDRGQMRVLLPTTEMDSAFAQLLGRETWEVNALAEVSLLPFTTGNNVIPYGLSTASSQYGSFQCIKVPPNGQSSVCPGSNQGNFGYVDIKRPTVASGWSCNGSKAARFVENTAAGIDHFLGTRDETSPGSYTNPNAEDAGLVSPVFENCDNATAAVADPGDDTLWPDKLPVVTGTTGSNCGNLGAGGLVEGLISPEPRFDGKGGRLTRSPSTQTYPWADYWRTTSWECGGRTWHNLDDVPLHWFMDPGETATNFVDGSVVPPGAGTVRYEGTSPWSQIQKPPPLGYGLSFPLGTTIESVLAGLDTSAQAAMADFLRGYAPSTANGSNLAPWSCDPVEIEAAPSVTQGMANCFNDYTAPREAYRILTGSTDISGCGYCYTVDLFSRDSDNDGKVDMEYSPRFTWFPEMWQDLETYLSGTSSPVSIKRFRGLFISTLFVGKNNGSLTGSWSVGDAPTNTQNQLNGFAGFVFDYEMLPQEVIDRQQQFPDGEPGFQLIR